MSADARTLESRPATVLQRGLQWGQRWALANQRLLLLSVVALVTLAELASAWKKWGTYDVTIFDSFAKTIDRVGPIDIYLLDEKDAGLMVYNHPPLVGWWLMVVNFFTNTVGLRFGFMIRLPSVFAHALTVLLIYDMVRRRKGDLIALVSGIAVALSPTLIILAGYHGNNDPVLAMFMLASVWLLVDRRAPLLAGAERRKTRLQFRGNFLDLGDEVKEGGPVALATGAKPQVANRLELAKWLMSPENPLTVHWDKNFLRVRGASIPGGEIEIHYLEAYCRPGSTDHRHRCW